MTFAPVIATLHHPASLLASFDWYWLIMIGILALIGVVFGGIVLLVVWMTGGLHDG